MLRKYIGDTATDATKFVSSLAKDAMSFLETGIFLDLALKESPKHLFKPLGLVMAAASIPAPLVEDKDYLVPYRIVSYITPVAANMAIWVFEGEMAATIFTAAIGADLAILLAQTIHKGVKAGRGEIEKSEVVDINAVLTTCKNGMILATINVGGTGQILELVKESESMPMVYKVLSGLTAGFATLQGGFGIFNKCKQLFGAHKKTSPLDQALLAGIEEEKSVSPNSRGFSDKSLALFGSKQDMHEGLLDDYKDEKSVSMASLSSKV